MRCRGSLSQWDDERGFGFITPTDGGNKVFLHVTEFQQRYQRPALNHEVPYTLSQDAQGRPRAVKASSPRQERFRHHRSSGVQLALFVTVLYLRGLYLAVVQGRVSMVLFVV